MKATKSICLLGLLFAVGGCRPQPDPVAFLTYSMDINGERYENKTAIASDNLQYLFAKARNQPDCPEAHIWVTISKPISKEAVLRLDFGIPGVVKNYTLGGYQTYASRCQTDSVIVNAIVDPQLKSVPVLDIVSLAAYKLAEGADNHMEVTRFDSQKKLIEARFQMKAVRFAGKLSLPLSDTLVITNGYFSAQYQSAIE